MKLYLRAEVDALIQAASDHGEALAEGKRNGEAATVESLLADAELRGRPLAVSVPEVFPGYHNAGYGCKHCGCRPAVVGCEDLCTSCYRKTHPLTNGA